MRHEAGMGRWASIGKVAQKRVLIAVSVAFVATLSTSCGDGSIKARVDSAVSRLETIVARLGDELDGGQLRNAQLIRQYAESVAEAKPKLRGLTRVLEQEATREGTLYRGLETRLADVKASLPPDGSRAEAYTAVAEELNSLAAAADPTEFNRALGDPLNVLADLSDGALPRVDAVSASASRAANGATDFGPGSQLVGNPNYGQWRTESSGTSFWVWYGQFALMRDLLGGPRIGYGAWAGGRDYSYYHDYGRRNYTSPAARTRQAGVASTARRKFASEGRTFNSPYAKQRQGASRTVARQKFASTGNRFGGARTGTSAGSSRTSSSRSSPASFRGFGGGGRRGPGRGGK